MTFRVYAQDLIEENKWRAVRWGLGGKLIDFGKKEQLPAPVLIRELVEWFLDDVLDELGTRKEVEYAFTILDHGSSAQRQLATYARTGDLRAVVDQLIRETAEGVCEPTLGPPLESTLSVGADVPGSMATERGTLSPVRGQSIP
jgi:carboxylate-amine ligase